MNWGAALKATLFVVAMPTIIMGTIYIPQIVMPIVFVAAVSFIWYLFYKVFSE